MPRFQPKTPEGEKQEAVKVYTKMDYLEMEKQVEKAKKWLDSLKEEQPKIYAEVKGTQAAWIIQQGGAVVLPYTKGKDDPKTDQHYFAVRPGPYHMLTEKWAWFERERDRKNAAQRHQDRAYEGMADTLGGKMRVHD